MADELLNKRESTLENLTLSFTISEQCMFTGCDVLRNAHCHGADNKLCTGADNKLCTGAARVPTMAARTPTGSEHGTNKSATNLKNLCSTLTICYVLGFGGTHFTASRLNRWVVVAKPDLRICGFAISDQNTSIFGSPMDVGCNH